MLILYPNYSLEIVGNYLAFPFQVVLLVSFKSNLFWLKFLHYEVFNVQRLFQGSPALSELLYCIAYQWFCQELFFNFSRRFFCPFPCEPLPLFCCFCSCMSPWQLDYLTKDIHSCQRFFLSFFDFFPALFSTPVPMPVSGVIVPLPTRSNLHSKACFVTSWSTGSFVRIRSSQA